MGSLDAAFELPDGYLEVVYERPAKDSARLAKLKQVAGTLKK
ncbi:MAG TPA: hypothetical protein VF469_13375 [Kofleriaceae bacterium]